MTLRFRQAVVAIGLAFGMAGPSAVLRGSDAKQVSFEREIQPILQRHCVACHGPDKQRADLRVDNLAALLKGGDSGPALQAGKADVSLLVKRVAAKDKSTRMPPRGEGLTAEHIALLRRWIDEGAKGPVVTTATDARKKHWAFQPRITPSLPAIEHKDWPANGIDHFILARLEQAKLLPSAEADRATLIRRLKFDLLGLPPTPEEVKEFVGDPDSQAYEKLVDKYLASPHFGERWARHWLDIVRFAESDGYEMNQHRPNAWPFRDWVIRSFNEDKPYDQFVAEQLAGDQAGADAATGFLVGGPVDRVKSPDIVLTLQQRADELHDIISTTGSTFLGLTVGCARCHNHKFDPISQLDYYGLKAVFAGVQHGERPLTTSGKKAVAEQMEKLREQLAALEDKILAFEPPLRAAVNPVRNVERFPAIEARWVKMTILETNQAQPCIDELEVFTPGPAATNVALAKLGTKARASGTLPGFGIHQLAHVNDGRYGNSWSWISDEAGKGWVELDLGQVRRIERIEWGRDRQGNYKDRLALVYKFEVAAVPGGWRTVAASDDHLPMKNAEAVLAKAAPEKVRLLRELLSKKHDLEARLQPALGAMAYAGRFTVPEKTFRLHRGDPMQKREPVAPAALAEFAPALALPADATDGQRRLALAKWITDQKHPLTARVIVNRLWHYHFGKGIVDSPSDLGVNGGRPTHPELLDWLAGELIANGWRLKTIHRLIVLSKTYRQASTLAPDMHAVDADSRLWWRYPPRRLEAEPLRDTILYVSGKLDLHMGGPGFDLFEPNTNYVKVYTPKKDFGPAEFRRMIYQSKPRMQLDDTFGAFDCPDAGQIAPRRSSSTTALQALNLLNSRFLLQQAEFFARRLEHDVGADVAAQVRRGFWLAFQREPTTEERTAALALVREHGLVALCRALFNANEFLYVF